MAFQNGEVNVGRGYYESSLTDWNLLATTGTRDYQYTVSFPTEFSNIPEVIVMMRGFHVQMGEDARVAVGVSDITATGFILHVNAWDDTSVVGVGVNWIAYDATIDGI